MSKVQRDAFTLQPFDHEALLSIPGTTANRIIEALIDGKTTAKSVAAANGMSPKQFHKALRRSRCSGWQDWLGTQASLCQSRTGVSALIVDDTVLGHPSGKKLPLGKVLFHQGWKRPLYSQNLVALGWTDGTRMILLGLREWVPDSGVTKHQIVREMLNEAIEQGVVSHWLLFDGWYLTPEMASWCSEHRIHWVSRMRRDRILETTEGPLDEAWKYRTDELASTFTSDQYRWYPEFRKYVKGVNVKCSLSPDPLRIAMVKQHFNSNLDDMKHFVSSAPLDIPSILRLVRLRWGIEVVFRYLKQHFGLEKCIIRTQGILLIWWKLLWHAYNVVAQVQEIGQNWARAKLIRLAGYNAHATRTSALEVA